MINFHGKPVQLQGQSFHGSFAGISAGHLAVGVQQNFLSSWREELNISSET